MKNKEKRNYSKRRRILAGAAGFFLLLYLLVIVWHTYKPLPDGVSYAGDVHNVDNIEMIYDLTYAQDKEGTGLEHELRIFDEVHEMIEQAEEFIVLDFFLFDNYNDQDIDFPEIGLELAEQLIAKRDAEPEVPIYFITDPVNSGYGSYESELIQQLKEADVEVIYTDLDPLRDSTPVYSGLYRIFFQWFDWGEGWLPNGIASQAPEMKLSSYMELMNVKANHRKAVITDKEAMVSSGNPHTASGFHGNQAFKVSGPILNDLLEAEEAVSHFSGGPDLPRVDVAEQDGPYTAQYITESEILDALSEDIKATGEGDTIWMAMFYLAHRDIVEELGAAGERGADIRLILDPNENSFGNEKSGLPNRPVVHELVEEAGETLEVRWYNAIDFQFHTKTVMIQQDGEIMISAGAANLTQRALKNYNLENNLRITAPDDSELAEEMAEYFNRLWDNEDALYTLDVEEYQDDFTPWQRVIYGFQELFKLTTY
ncbi:phospholipase D-like domain-containing protein [Planomicrobium sp. YIM 101495]|uniref:phospholipase D-like domain-containing protein n=1 Tax=Planomicrobium sp. YIM 101495 TaxID=2665160 RepID=UPI0013F92338|nr:phospholipase [Planomicrobium sp. YIM 101495]